MEGCMTAPCKNAMGVNLVLVKRPLESVVSIRDSAGTHFPGCAGQRSDVRSVQNCTAETTTALSVPVPILLFS